MAFIGGKPAIFLFLLIVLIVVEKTVKSQKKNLYQMMSGIVINVGIGRRNVLEMNPVQIVRNNDKFFYGVLPWGFTGVGIVYVNVSQR